jgi:phosphatidylethanolamine-binding protein (PEBP) family uncharacterized protein
MAMTLRSAAFQEGEAIPTQCACARAGESPPLDWGGAPAQTGAYALIADDPDALLRVFTH